MSGNNSEVMIRTNKGRKKGQPLADQRLINERNKIINYRHFLEGL
jgi:hypothetical protein